jgi:hypothetical protein
MLVESFGTDDSTQRECGREQHGVTTGTVDGTLWDTVTARIDPDVPPGRKNEEGWQYWRKIIASIGVDSNVQGTLEVVRNCATQRTHCAALTRFCYVCRHLGYDADNITTFDILVKIATTVLNWSAQNGAKLFWVKAMRTALSVLFNYRGGTMYLDKDFFPYS